MRPTNQAGKLTGPSRTLAFARSEISLIGQARAQYNVIRPIGGGVPQKGPQKGKGKSQRPVTPLPVDTLNERDVAEIVDRDDYGGSTAQTAAQARAGGVAQAAVQPRAGGGASVMTAPAPSQRYDSEFDDESLDELDSPGPIREADAPAIVKIAAAAPPQAQIPPAPAKKSNLPLLLIGGGVLALLLFRK
jgi:hypothetical protein